MTTSVSRGRQSDAHVGHVPQRSASGGSTHTRGATSVSRAWQDDVEVATLNTKRPRQWAADLSTLPKDFMRQIFGFNPFKTSYFSLYRPLKSLESRLILGCAIIFSIAAGIPLPIIGYLFGQIINEFPPPEEELITRLEELIGVAVAYLLVTWIWSVCWSIVGERVSRGMREELVRKVIGLEIAYFDVHSPDMSSILTGDTQTIHIGTSEKVGLFIQSVSYFVAAFVVGFILNAKLTGIMFAAVIPAMFIVVICGTTTVSKLSKRATKFSEQAGRLAESAVGAVAVVQAFGIDKVLSDQHTKVLSQACRTGFKKGIAGALMLGAVYFIAYSANSLAFWEGSQLISGGAGTVYAVVFLILDASFVVGQFGPFVQSLALAASVGGKVLELIDREESSINVYTNEGIEVGDDAAQQDICFERVTFVYPARPTVRVLDAVDLRFRAGTITGIVGLSGSGKSTIASLILRLYDTTSGSVIMGGTNMKEYNLRDLRSRISLVDQDPVLFTGTILQNISHGILNRDELSEGEVLSRCIQAATAANADFISQLSQGIRTKIGGTGGTQLSGGQKQRICLARGLVRHPSILILDEPTSALDTTSEKLILEALRNVSSKGCTVITIAHRLATIRDSDNIMLMSNGKLLEEGSHNDLLERDGPYTQLVEAQKLENESETAHDIESMNLGDPKESYAAQARGIERKIEGSSADVDNSAATDISEHSDKKPSLSTLSLLARCFAMSRPERLYIALGILASMVSGGLIIGEAIIFGNLVSILNTSAGSPEYQKNVDFYCLMFFVVALAALGAYSTSGSVFGLVSEHLVRRMRDTSLRTILRQDMAWFSLPGHGTHELIATMNTDASRLSGLSGVLVGTIFSVATSVFGGIILAHIVAWRIAVVLLAAVPVMIAAGFMRLRVLSTFEKHHESAYNEAAALASEACRNIRTVAAFGREDDVFQEYRAALRKPQKRIFKFIVFGNLLLAFSFAITYFVYAVAYYWGARQVREGYYNQKQFFTVLPALLFSAQASGQMFSLAPEVTRAKSAANSLFSLHDQEPSIMSRKPNGNIDQMTEWRSEKLLEKSSSGSSTIKSADLSFQNVNLAYPSRPNTKVLKDVSLEIEAGGFVGIVGASGAGKSSIMALLERFYDPTTGSISLGGVDIQTMPVEVYRSRLSLVAQEPDLFSGSISFNIGLGARPGQSATQEDIEATCKLLNIHDFIMSLPQAYQTECGQNGSQLSGGQTQRIAIARALIRDPDILLLDEATASLDAHSDSQVQDAVAVAKKRGRTTIVVAHRLSSVQKADRIFVFDRGRLVEVGTHEELIALEGIYTSMVQAQEVG